MQEGHQGDHRASSQVSGRAKIQVGSQLGVPKAKGLVWESGVDGGDSDLWGLLHGSEFKRLIGSESPAWPRQPAQPLPGQLLTEEYCEQRDVLKGRVPCANLQHSLRKQG